MLLGADSVVFSKKTTLEAFDMALPASSFRVRATVNVQVAMLHGQRGV
jgi:hypothetical protein